MLLRLIMSADMNANAVVEMMRLMLCRGGDVVYAAGADDSGVRHCCLVSARLSSLVVPFRHGQRLLLPAFEITQTSIALALHHPKIAHARLEPVRLLDEQLIASVGPLRRRAELALQQGGQRRHATAAVDVLVEKDQRSQCAFE